MLLTTKLLTMKLAAILSSNQSSQTSRLFENHLRNCPGTQKIFTLLLNLRLVCSFIKRTNGILLSDQTPEISQFKVSLHISRKHIWKINRTQSNNWWLKHSLYTGEDTEATTKQAVDTSWLGYICSVKSSVSQGLVLLELSFAKGLPLFLQHMFKVTAEQLNPHVKLQAESCPQIKQWVRQIWNIHLRT